MKITIHIIFVLRRINNNIVQLPVWSRTYYFLIFDNIDSINIEHQIIDLNNILHADYLFSVIQKKSNLT